MSESTREKLRFLSVVLLQRRKNLLHQIDDRRETKLKRDREELGDPGDREEGDESDDETDDCVADGVDSLLDLLVVAGREDEGDAPDDDEEEAEERGRDERERDEGRHDLDDTAVFEEFT